MKNKNKIFYAETTLAIIGVVTVFCLLGFGLTSAYFWAFVMPAPSDAFVTVPRDDTDYSCLNALLNTPMAEAIPHIKQASAYYQVPPELFVGIAFAESSFKRFKCYNPWGIGDNGPRCYNDWEHGVNGFAQLIRYYYLDEGLKTAEQIMPKYVGWNNPDWIKNVKTYYK